MLYGAYTIKDLKEHADKYGADILHKHEQERIFTYIKKQEQVALANSKEKDFKSVM